MQAIFNLSLQFEEFRNCLLKIVFPVVFGIRTPQAGFRLSFWFPLTTAGCSEGSRLAALPCGSPGVQRLGHRNGSLLDSTFRVLSRTLSNRGFRQLMGEQQINLHFRIMNWNAFGVPTPVAALMQQSRTFRPRDPLLGWLFRTFPGENQASGSQMCSV